MNNRQESKVYGPFDETATTNLIEMGILQSDGSSNESILTSFTVIFAGLFFIDLKQFYDNTDNIAILYNMFSALYSKKHYSHMYLLYSIQYDYFRKPLPDPVWWIAGRPELITTFMNGFLAHLGRLIEESGILSKYNEGGAKT